MYCELQTVRCFISNREQLAIDLWKAVRDGQVDKVISLLKRGANPNYPPYFNQDWMLMHSGLGTWPPLHAACEAGNLSITKALVEGGADANKCSAFYTMTPLHRACIKGHKKVALYLIEEAKSKIGKNLIFSARTNSIQDTCVDCSRNNRIEGAMTKCAH